MKVYFVSHSTKKGVVFFMLKTHVMKMNTENTNCFVYETDELLIELLGATFTIFLNKSVRIFGQVQKGEI